MPNVGFSGSKQPTTRIYQRHNWIAPTLFVSFGQMAKILVSAVQFRPQPPLSMLGHQWVVKEPGCNCQQNCQQTADLVKLGSDSPKLRRNSGRTR